MMATGAARVAAIACCAVLCAVPAVVAISGTDDGAFADGEDSGPGTTFADAFYVDGTDGETTLADGTGTTVFVADGLDSTEEGSAVDGSDTDSSWTTSGDATDEDQTFSGDSSVNPADYTDESNDQWADGDTVTSPQDTADTHIGGVDSFTSGSNDADIFGDADQSFSSGDASEADTYTYFSTTTEYIGDYDYSADAFGVDAVSDGGRETVYHTYTFQTSVADYTDTDAPPTAAEWDHEDMIGTDGTFWAVSDNNADVADTNDVDEGASADSANADTADVRDWSTVTDDDANIASDSPVSTPVNTDGADGSVVVSSDTDADTNSDDPVVIENDTGPSWAEAPFVHEQWLDSADSFEGCADDDGDGVCDLIDNCPDDANSDQADEDEDGVGDVCDACLGDASNDEDGDGICGNDDDCPLDPDNDADDDGVCGDEDNCPDDANSDQADEDGDYVGDACDADGNFPINCNAAQTSGLHRIYPTGPEDGGRLVYCDAEQDPPAASVFYLDDVNDFQMYKDEKRCFSTGVDDDHDNHMLWVDGTTMIGAMDDFDEMEDDATFHKFHPNGLVDRNFYDLPGHAALPEPFTVGTGAGPFPVPFYAAGVTVWIQFDVDALWWDGADRLYTLSELCECCTAGFLNHVDGESARFFYDGVSKLTVGAFGEECLATVEFDFVHNNVRSSGRPAVGLPQAHDPFWDESSALVEETVFGDQLPTVNGRVFRLADEKHFVLDGPASAPWGAEEDMTLLRHPFQAYLDDTGLDFLSHVDDMGRVWLMDHGHDDGGLFHCNYHESDWEDMFIGAVPTNIRALGFNGPGCGPGMFFDAENHACESCSAPCADGQGASSTCDGWNDNVCHVCDASCDAVAGCGSTPTTCGACAAGYYRDDEGDCVACGEGCTLCEDDTGDCVACARTHRFVEDSGECEPANLPHYTDADGDFVCDAVDVCPDANDHDDGDEDGAPDECDPCPVDPLDDQDVDTTCDSEDLCEGFDDFEDDDGDGVPDGCDNCPFRKNANQLDSDGDGRGDLCDNCPQHFQDAQTDGDGDGTGDLCDKCPANPYKAASKGACGCDVLDVDADFNGIMDCKESTSQQAVSASISIDFPDDFVCDESRLATVRGMIAKALNVDASLITGLTCDQLAGAARARLLAASSFSYQVLVPEGDDPATIQAAAADTAAFTEALQEATNEGTLPPATVGSLNVEPTVQTVSTCNDADGDTVCDKVDVCPGGDDRVDVAYGGPMGGMPNGVPDACDTDCGAGSYQLEPARVSGGAVVNAVCQTCTSCGTDLELVTPCGFATNTECQVRAPVVSWDIAKSPTTVTVFTATQNAAGVRLYVVPASSTLTCQEATADNTLHSSDSFFLEFQQERATESRLKALACSNNFPGNSVKFTITAKAPENQGGQAPQLSSVVAAIGIPVQQEEFTPNLQFGTRQAIADATGQLVDDVQITNISVDANGNVIVDFDIRVGQDVGEETLNRVAADLSAKTGDGTVATLLVNYEVLAEDNSSGVALSGDAGVVGALSGISGQEAQEEFETAQSEANTWRATGATFIVVLVFGIVGLHLAYKWMKNQAQAELEEAVEKAIKAERIKLGVVPPQDNPMRAKGAAAGAGSPAKAAAVVPAGGEEAVVV